jgi:tetratricopeptide (TPR) repeat protein
MIKRNLLFVFLFLSQVLTGQKASITVETRDILTYPYSDPDPVPVLADRRDDIFPYHTFEGYSLKGRVQKWNVVKLENDYIEVWVLPSDGGKVWGAIEKSTGKEFIYRNEVMKYRNISMRGPWTSGGIEFNFGLIGHNPSTCVPVDYKTVENADGSVSCFVGSLDLPSRTSWTVEIRLPKDKAWFETRATWTNPTSLPQTYYNWMTAAAVVTDDLEFAYPGNQEIGHGGEQGPWPINEVGRNVAFYKENNFESSKSYHVVGEYNDFMGGYYHNSGFGFGHWALYDEMPGHKLWLWSLARDGGIWEDLLTDTDGQYMEFQAGRMFNQYSASSKPFNTPISQTQFTPGLTDKWREVWFPVKEIGGLKDVSPIGVMNVKPENGKLQIGINALAFADAKIIVKSEGKVIFTENRKFSPMDVYETSVPLNEKADYEVVVEGMDLQYNPSKRQLLCRPFVSTIPTNIVTPTSLYQQGMELKEGRGYTKAKGYFKLCLQTDPLYIEAMSALSELYYRSCQYDSSLYYANNARQLDTYNPGANYFAGLTYRAMGKLTDALESFGWAARFPEYRSPAYAQMAAIELALDNKPLTLHYAGLALDFNRYNLPALEVLAILNRNSGETTTAEKYIDEIDNLYPLNHFSDFERNLLHPSDENLSRFTSSITNEMPYQTYIELCMIYYNLGQKNEAIKVLDKAPDNPLITIWKAFLIDDASLLDKVTSASPAFVFPYRTETITALTWALSKNNNWKFKYYIALNYAAIQRSDDAISLLKACGQQPDYAPFYLTRAAMADKGDENQELMDLQTAVRLAPDDWRSIGKLIDYYDRRQNYKMTLILATEAYKKHKNNSDIGVKYALAQINNGQYAKSLKTIEGMNILPSEGSQYGKVIFEQASLFLSIDLIKNKKYTDAIKMIEKSEEWPENLGVGKPYNVDIRVQDYLKMFCLGKMKKTGDAEPLRNSVIEYTKQNPAPSFSNILALKLLKEKGETEATGLLIQKFSPESNPINKWVMAISNNDQAVAGDLEKGFSENPEFQIVKKALEVTGK